MPDGDLLRIAPSGYVCVYDVFGGSRMEMLVDQSDLMI